MSGSVPTPGPLDPVGHVTALVARSGSSFTLGMKILPPERRDAMFAVYAFCREVDDIADGFDPAPVKLAGLEAWRREIDALYDGRPTLVTARALAGPVARFALPREEFVAVIDGMAMDLRDGVMAPDLDTLMLYCRRVAGAVGLLSLPIFGAAGEEARRFALALGEALQLTNILRDIDEDAERGRLYLPADVLARHGIATAGVGGEGGGGEVGGAGGGLAAVLSHPALDAACRELAAVARARFAEADRALARCDRRTLRPALLMMGIYEAILDRLERRGWAGSRALPRAGTLAKLRAALFKGLWRRPVRKAG